MRTERVGNYRAQVVADWREEAGRVRHHHCFAKALACVLRAAAPFALEDYACEGSGDAAAGCVLDCPRRDCTGAIGRCYEHDACVAVEIKGGSAAFATLKRRRRPAP